MVWISMTYLLCTVKRHKKENGNLYLRSKDSQRTSLGAIKKYITDSNIQSLSVGTQLHGVYLIFQQGKTTEIGEI